MPLLILTFLLTPSILFAADSGFVPLVGIPYVDTASGSVSLGDYVNSLYWASISIAAVLAVLRIIWAGIKYMLSEIVTEKGQAKKDIQGALYGLILIIGAVLLLDTINPTITKLTALDLKPLTSEVGGHGGGGSVPDTASEYCGSLTANDSCLVFTCSATGAAGAACAAKCSKAQGVYTVSGGARTGAIGSCAHSKNNAIAQLLAEQCPPGKTCTTDVCKNLVFSCAGACTTYGGIHYDDSLNVCIHDGPKTLTIPLGNIQCVTSGDPICDADGNCNYDATTVDCTSAERVCTERGGTRSTISAAVVSCFKETTVTGPTDEGELLEDVDFSGAL